MLLLLARGIRAGSWLRLLGCSRLLEAIWLQAVAGQQRANSKPRSATFRESSLSLAAFASLRPGAASYLRPSACAIRVAVSEVRPPGGGVAYFALRASALGLLGCGFLVAASWFLLSGCSLGSRASAGLRPACFRVGGSR